MIKLTRHSSANPWAKRDGSLCNKLIKPNGYFLVVWPHLIVSAHAQLLRVNPKGESVTRFSFNLKVIKICLLRTRRTLPKHLVVQSSSSYWSSLRCHWTRTVPTYRGSCSPKACRPGCSKQRSSRRCSWGRFLGRLHQLAWLIVFLI